MDEQVLAKIGLTDAEARIYHAMLKLGACTVKDIAKECGFHRTNIYDILEQLKEKGLVSFAKEGKTTKYRAADPSNLYELLEERKDLLDTLFPQLASLYGTSSEQIEVEVYKGKEGMKAAFRDMLRQEKPLYAFGVKGQLRAALPEFAQQWVREAKRKKIKYYGIYTEQNPPAYSTEIRYVSKELSSPVATFIYGDKININIWEPSLVAIVIKSQLVASMYKNHFDLLWKIARKTN